MLSCTNRRPRIETGHISTPTVLARTIDCAGVGFVRKCTPAPRDAARRRGVAQLSAGASRSSTSNDQSSLAVPTGPS